MVDVQLENGHIRIANNLFEALLSASVDFNLTASEYSVLLAIFRLTYGFHKKTVCISQEKLSEITKITNKGYLSRVTKSLSDKNIIMKITEQGRQTEYGINKQFDTWRTIAPQCTTTPECNTIENQAQTITPECSTALEESTTLPVQQSTALQCNKLLHHSANTPYIKTCIKNNSKDNKVFYAENVSMTEEEFNKLVERFGEFKTRDKIEDLSLYKKSTGKKYKDDYATLINWLKKDDVKEKIDKPKLQYGNPKNL